MRQKLGLAPWHFAEITDIDNIKPELERIIGGIVEASKSRQPSATGSRCRRTP